MSLAAEQPVQISQNPQATGAEGYAAVHDLIRRTTGAVDVTTPPAFLTGKYEPTRPIHHANYMDSRGAYVIHDGVQGRDIRVGIADRDMPRAEPLHEVEFTRGGLVNARHTDGGGAQHEVRGLNADGTARYVTIARRDKDGSVITEDLKGNRARSTAGKIALQAAWNVRKGVEPRIARRA